VSYSTRGQCKNDVAGTEFDLIQVHNPISHHIITI
jgi:hypothetical protein